MGLEYRAIGVGGNCLTVLGIVDFCVAEQHRGNGIGSSMLDHLEKYAQNKPVDFIILISEVGAIYSKNGYSNVSAERNWLKVHEHQSYGVEQERIGEFYVKALGEKKWPNGVVDWLGYMF